MTTRKRKKGRCRLKKDNILIFILLVVLIALVVWLVLMAKDIFSKNSSIITEPQIVEKIDIYDYYLTDHNTKYYKELFNELKEVLNEDIINEEEYASLVAKLFVVDFYDLDSKSSKSDVGGIQFIASTYQDIFVKKASASNGIYYYVKSDIYNDRKQDLPIVKKVEISSMENTTFSHDKIKDDNAYLITLDVTYKKDLGYPNTVILTLAHNDSKIEIVEVK